MQGHNYGAVIAVAPLISDHGDVQADVADSWAHEVMVSTARTGALRAERPGVGYRTLMPSELPGRARHVPAR
jgi:hypothetical protein